MADEMELKMEMEMEMEMEMDVKSSIYAVRLRSSNIKCFDKLVEINGCHLIQVMNFGKFLAKRCNVVHRDGRIQHLPA